MIDTSEILHQMYVKKLLKKVKLKQELVTVSLY